jgi:hypothetical protein
VWTSINLPSHLRQHRCNNFAEAWNHHLKAVTLDGRLNHDLNAVGEHLGRTLNATWTRVRMEAGPSGPRRALTEAQIQADLDAGFVGPVHSNSGGGSAGRDELALVVQELNREPNEASVANARAATSSEQQLLNASTVDAVTAAWVQTLGVVPMDTDDIDGLTAARETLAVNGFTMVDNPGNGYCLDYAFLDAMQQDHSKRPKLR